MQPPTRITMALTSTRTHFFKTRCLKIYSVTSSNTCTSHKLSLTTIAERMHTLKEAIPSSQLMEVFILTNQRRILTGWARKPLGFTLQVKLPMRPIHCCRGAQTARGLSTSPLRGLCSRILLARTRSSGMEILFTQTFRCGQIRHQRQPTWPTDSSKRIR